MITELVMNEFMELGEGPIWDEKEQALYWVDTDLKQVHKYCPKSNERKFYDVYEKAGAVIKESDNTLICALEKGIYRLNETDGTLELISAPECDKPENIFNDGKCDKEGNFWIGTMHYKEIEGKGTLYCLDKEMKCEPKVEKVTISNGIAWALDYKTMYYIDTPTMQVVAYDYDMATCTISNKRPVIEFSEDQGYPDGMTIDENGNLWIAMWGGWCVYQCDPRTGEFIDKIELPMANVTSCTFGGEDMDTLYITTAYAELTEDEKKSQPLAGGVFRVKPGVKGFPSNRFGK